MDIEQTSTQACCGKAMNSTLVATLNNTQLSFYSIVNYVHIENTQVVCTT